MGALKKPRIAFFPKYLASFPGSSENGAANLKAMGFVEVPQKPHLYAHGKRYGDFSAQSLRLHVSINAQPVLRTGHRSTGPFVPREIL